jgi:hypothetical protein
MTYMWWRAEGRAERYETRWIEVNERLPSQIIEFTEQHRRTYRALARAVRAQMQGIEDMSKGEPLRISTPPVDLDDGGE